MFKTLKLLAVATLLISTFSQSIESAQVTISPYDHERDYSAVKAILEADSKDLLYPDQPLEYTVRYLTSSKYKTNVLRVNDETVGFVNYCVYDAKILWIYTWDRVSVLHLLGIDKEHRRKGYAKLLSEHAIEFCKNDGASYIALQTKPDNASARNLYEHLGFKSMNGFTFVLNFK
jgi:ribosomal protein S18 acetylase RimI-like enzyme